MKLQKPMLLFALVGLSSCSQFDAISRGVPLEAGDYEVCRAYPPDSVGHHILLNEGDRVVISSIGIETSVIFRRVSENSIKALDKIKEAHDLKVPMRFAIGREWISTRYLFPHQGKLHWVRIENEPEPPDGCIDPEHPRVIVIRFCYLGEDYKGTPTFQCRGPNPHYGDTHAHQ